MVVSVDVEVEVDVDIVLEVDGGSGGSTMVVERSGTSELVDIMGGIGGVVVGSGVVVSASSQSHAGHSSDGSISMKASLLHMTWIPSTEKTPLEYAD